MNLNPAEHFKNSQFDTIAFCLENFSVNNVAENVFVVRCNVNFSSPPPEILSIPEIKSIQFQNIPELNIPLIFTMLSEMPNLESIHFYHSGIKNIPPEIGKMKRLRSLTLEWDISGNIKSWEIKPVPPEFGELENLEELNLINCSSFYKGFPAESLNLRNLKTVKVVNDSINRKLPENMEFLPNLERLYIAGLGVDPPDIEPIIKELNTIKSVTIKDNFHRWKELSEKFPNIEFINDGRKLTAELTELSDERKDLPPFSEFLTKQRTELEQAQFAYLTLKKHLALNGLKLREGDPPFSWNSFGWDLYLNIDKFVSEQSHQMMLKKLLAELTDFCEAATGELFAYTLKVLFEKFIQGDPPRSKFVPLLPQKALTQLGEIEEMLDDDHERYMEILNQQGY